MGKKLKIRTKMDHRMSSGNWRQLCFGFSVFMAHSYHMVTASHGNAFGIVGPLWGESTGDPFPLAEVQCGVLMYFCELEHAVEQKVKVAVGWDTITLMWCYCDDRMTCCDSSKILINCSMTFESRVVRKNCPLKIKYRVMISRGTYESETSASKHTPSER